MNDIEALTFLKKSYKSQADFRKMFLSETDSKIS